MTSRRGSGVHLGASQSPARAGESINFEVRYMQHAGSVTGLEADLCGCSLPRLSRLNRSGLVDSLFSLFGRYPWICRSCGSRSYRTARGRKRSESTKANEAGQRA